MSKVKRFSARRILTIVTSAVIGLILLLLVVPVDFTGHLQLLGICYSLAPILLMATVLSFIVGKPSRPSAKAVSHKTHALLALGVVLASTVSVVSAKISQHIYTFDLTHNKFVYQNTATALMFTSFVLAVALINSQNFVYWPLWNSADEHNADERQKFVRQRVFEKAYRYLILAFVLALWLFNNSDSFVKDILLAWSVLILISLPGIIAAWQKDS